MYENKKNKQVELISHANVIVYEFILCKRPFQNQHELLDFLSYGLTLYFPIRFGQIPPPMLELGGSIQPLALGFADSVVPAELANRRAGGGLLPPNPRIGGGISPIRVGNE